MSQTLVDAPSRNAAHLTKAVFVCKKNRRKNRNPKVRSSCRLAHLLT